jgi:hypothetical protein
MDWSLPPEAGDTDTLGLIVFLVMLATVAALLRVKKSSEDSKNRDDENARDDATNRCIAA